MGKTEYGKSDHLFEALNNAFEVQFFSGLQFYNISHKMITCRAMKLRFLRAETLLNNVFKTQKMNFCST